MRVFREFKKKGNQLLKTTSFIWSQFSFICTQISSFKLQEVLTTYLPYLNNTHLVGTAFHKSARMMLLIFLRWMKTVEVRGDGATTRASAYPKEGGKTHRAL